jgi:AcrR family transcriptional regulator
VSEEQTPDRLVGQRRARTESPRANSRAALIEAAFEEFSDKGYESATVAGIAERAGVTTGALYAHFPGKLELLLETVGLVSTDDMLRTVTDIASLPWAQAVAAFSSGMAATPDRRTLLLLDVIVSARRDPAAAETLRRGLDEYLDAMKRAADGGIALGLIDPAFDSDDLARILAIINLGMIVFATLEERPPSDRAFSRITELFLESAGPRSADEPAALTRVRARAAAADKAQRALHDAIADAVQDGHSLRHVGAAAALSHERVRQVIRERSADKAVN